jgi:hypothetical protein
MAKKKKTKQKFLKSFLVAILLATSIFVVPRVSRAALSPDLNSDGCINQADYDQFKTYVTANPKDVLGDINADAKVDTKDLAFIMNGWNPSCVPTTSSSKLRHIWQGDLGSLGATKVTFLAQHMDVVIMKLDACSSNQGTNLASLKSQAAAAGRTIKVLQYFKFAGTHTDQSPVDSQCQAPSFAPQFVSQNLMWMSPDGTPYVDAGNHWMYMDVQNPTKVLAYLNLIVPYLKNQLSTFPIDGFFFDNAMLLGSSETAHLVSGSYVVGRPANYDAETLWNGKYSILQGLRQDSVLSQKIFFPNNFWNKLYIPGLPTTDGNYANNAFQQTMDRLQFYNVADGLVRERPFWQEANDIGECYDKVNTTLDSFGSVASSKSVILYAYGTATVGRIYSLANALMVNHDNVYYLAGPLGGNYYWPEYDIDLGAPTGSATKPQSDMYVRDFANGKVVVYTKANNCGSSGTASYDIGPGYEMLTGFTGTGAYTDIGTMVWTAAPTIITFDATHPAYVLRKP